MTAEQAKIFEHGSVCLGYVGFVAAWRRAAHQDHQHRFPPMLVIYEAATIDENCVQPAASITLTGREGLIALREAIDEALC